MTRYFFNTEPPSPLGSNPPSKNFFTPKPNLVPAGTIDQCLLKCSQVVFLDKLLIVARDLNADVIMMDRL